MRSRIFRRALSISTLAAALSLPVVAHAHPFGLGVMVGEPTGLSGKQWLGSHSAVDFGASWALEKNENLHLHADYLWHSAGFISSSEPELGAYIGVGGRVLFLENSEDRIGVRVPLGVSYQFSQNRFELFFEVAPVVDLVPDTETDLGGGIGLRYQFR